MTVALAAAWYPRGELSRFLRLMPRLKEVYSHIVVSLPPEACSEVQDRLEAQQALSFTVSPDWSWGRHIALGKAYETGAAHIHYADLDRLLRWVEVFPHEWQHIVKTLQEHDCLIVGRTAIAYSTHPQALVQTEAISNLVFSKLLGKAIDLSAGSKGFSRRAVEFILSNTAPGRALGTDAEWPVVLQRGGFTIESIFVDGLDWESADRYRDHAADPASQRSAADTYDADPLNWARRVQVAYEIVQAGLEAMERKLVGEIK